MLVELHPSHSVDLTHAIDRSECALAGHSIVAKHYLQIRHGIILGFQINVFEIYVFEINGFEINVLPIDAAACVGLNPI